MTSEVEGSKCGEIYLTTSKYIFLCCICNEQLEDFSLFREHNEFFHPDENRESTHQDYFDDLTLESKVETIDFDYDEQSNYEESIDFKQVEEVDELLMEDEPCLQIDHVTKLPELEEGQDDIENKISEDEFELLAEESGEDFRDDELFDDDFENENLNNTSIKRNRWYRKKSVYCSFCNFEFKCFHNHDQQKCENIQKIIKAHNSDVESLREVGIFLCTKCPRYFEKQRQLTHHRRSHHSTCPLCSKKYSNLEAHMEAFHEQKNFEINSQIHISNDDIKDFRSVEFKHVTEASDNENTKIDITQIKEESLPNWGDTSEDEKSKDSNEIKRQQRNISRRKSVKCPHCNLDFRPSQCHDHAKCEKVQEIIKAKNNDYYELEKEGVFLCKKCPRYYDNSRSLIYHQSRHNDSGICRYCNKSFIKLKDHIKFNHPGKDFQKPKQEKTNQTFKCAYCGKKFQIYRYLKKHELKHENRVLNCPYCGVYKRSNNSLESHIRTHTGEKPFQCSECPAAFAIKKNLKTHFIYKHTEEKPFTCRYEGCEKSFKTDNLRFYHEKTHTENVDYQCEICGKGFNIKNKLTNHIKINHVDYNLRPHKCDFCDRRFVKKFSLAEHIRTHTGEKPLKCDICSRTFGKNSCLREHQKLHSNKKTHICGICGKAFAQRAGYLNHLKYHPTPQ